MPIIDQNSGNRFMDAAAFETAGYNYGSDIANSSWVIVTRQIFGTATSPADRNNQMIERVSEGGDSNLLEASLIPLTGTTTKQKRQGTGDPATACLYPSLGTEKLRKGQR